MGACKRIEPSDTADRWRLYLSLSAYEPMMRKIHDTPITCRKLDAISPERPAFNDASNIDRLKNEQIYPYGIAQP
jgi:hypothetical protein